MKNSENKQLNIEKLKKLISENEDTLMDKVLDYAKLNGYTKYTSTLKEAWRLSISGLSNSLLKAIEKSSEIPELSPDDDFSKKEISEFGIIEAQKHRLRGVSLGMFMGLMKYYAQGYYDLINEAHLPIYEKKYFTQYLRRVFDHIELGFAVEWSGIKEKQLLEGLQETNRAITNEKNKYLTIFESIYDPVILFDAENNIENINKKAAEIFLNEYEYASGKKYYCDCNNLKINQVFDWLNEEIMIFLKMDKDEITLEKNIDTKSGERIYLIKLKKMLDISEKFKGTVVVLSDITEKIKFQNELEQRNEMLNTAQKQLLHNTALLKESEEKYRTVFETTGSATIIIEEDMVISLANEEFCRLSGLSSQEIENKKKITDFLGSDEMARISESHRLRRTHPEMVPKHFEVKAVNSRGEKIDLFVSVALIADTKKSIASMIDITEQKNIEREIEKKTDELNDAMYELTKQNEQLKSTQAQLVQSEKMAGLGVLTSGLAHEINNPINYVYLSGKLLEKEIENFKNTILASLNGNDGEVVDYFMQKIDGLYQPIQHILEGSNRIKIILRDLLMFSNLDKAEQKLLDISEAIETTIRLIQIQFKNKITFTTNIDRSIVLKCFPSQLNQVFLNVIVNACQAIMKKIPGSNPDYKGAIIVTSVNTENEVLISFEDNGVGMAENVKSRIFEPFFTTKPVGEGTGLGMSISYSIIENHNGRIEIESEEGNGTTVTLYLPNDI